MAHAATRIIRAEHAALKAVLLRLQLVLSHHRDAGTLPDFGDLRVMLFYIDEFPEKLHHRKETDVLFPKLRACAPGLRHLMDRLDNEHVRGEYNIRQVEHALLAFEVMGVTRRDAFERALGRFTDFYFDHMELEEREILPLAETLLQDADWLELDAAFASHHDVLAGGEPTHEYEALFTRIFSVFPDRYLPEALQARQARGGCQPEKEGHP
ncbi:MAG: hemerythrin domain-containing protein [Pseudomonadota bacterium]